MIKFTILTIKGAQSSGSDIETELCTLNIEVTPATSIYNFWDPAPQALPDSSRFHFKAAAFQLSSLCSTKQLTLSRDKSRIQGDSQKLPFKFTQVPPEML